MNDLIEEREVAMLNEWPCEWERKEWRGRETRETQKLQLSSDRKREKQEFCGRKLMTCLPFKSVCIFFQKIKNKITHTALFMT